jgi:DNA-binding MarR family transcriptional regulator
MTKKGNENTHSEDIIVALRRVVRSIDMHSRSLLQSHGLTGPQALILAKLYASKALSAKELATALSLSQATITDILKRLDAKKFINRETDIDDRRVTRISLTKLGQEMHASAPPLLQHKFDQQFSQLKEWEQHLLISSLQRIAELMDSEAVDPSPALTTSLIL